MKFALKTIFSGGELSRRKYLKEILDVAEEIAQGKDVKFEFILKRK